MSAEDVKQLIVLLDNGLSPDKAIRENSEKVLIQSATNNTSQMVQTLLAILAKSDTQGHVKKSVCVWLQKILSSYQSSLPELYSKVSDPVREQFKKEIFIILHGEADLDIRKQISDTIGEVGGSLLSNKTVADACGVSNEALWPNLLANVMELYSLGDEKSIESALNIFTILFLYISEKLGQRSDEIGALIQKSMEINNRKIQMLAIQTLGSLITTLSSKEVKKYFKFAVPVLKILYEMFFGPNANVDYGCEVLTVVGEIVETDPKFFRTNFKDLIDCMGRIRAMNDIEGGVKDQALEVTISISQRYPEFLQENKAILSQIVEMVFLHMLEIPDECPAEWANPPDGFDEKKMDDDSQKVVKFATDCIDRLCANVGSAVMLKYLSDCVAQLIKTGEWKKMFASFMALSQVGEYMEDVEEIRPIVQLLKNSSTHPEPRVRYAVIHCLGQIADDFAPKFQEVYHDEVIPVLMERMDDPVPRVVGHACASATNFLENCQESHLKPHMDILFKKITGIIDKASSYVKENALSALSALSVGAPDLFKPYYETTMEVLLKILVEVNNPIYKRLRGNSIECISIISQQVGVERFLPYADRLIQAMINIQDHHLDKEEDPQRNFILMAWPRITEVLKEKFDAYVPQVAPSIIKVCLNVAENIPKEEDVTADSATADEDDKKKKEDYHTFFDDECNNALSAVECFMEDCPVAMAPYIEQVYKVVTPLLDYLTNEEVRTTAAQCLPCMAECLKKHPTLHDKLPQFSKELISKLWAVMDEETEPEVLIKQATAMQDLVEASGDIFDPADLEMMYSKCIDHLKRSDERKKLTDEQIDEEEDEIEVLEVHEQDKDLENQLHCTIAEIFGKIFQTHKEKALPIFEQLHTMFIATSLQDSQTDMIKKFGLFLICDSVDHLGLLIGEARLEQYYQYLKKYCLYPMVFVRHAAVYGLGAMALVLKDRFLPCAVDSLHTLKQSLAVPRGPEEEEVYKATRDNTASAIGKVIKATFTKHSEDVLKAMVDEWLSLLPLKIDKVEAIIMHEFLVELLEKHRNIVLSKIENLEKVLKCISSIWKTKISNEAIDARMSALMAAWVKEPEMAAAMQKVNLNEKQQSWIKKVIEAGSK
jgi:hypothetical protein